MPLKVMDPSDKLNWSHNWIDFLASGDSISSRQWTIDPDASPTLLSNATAESVTVDNLTAGVVYRLSEKITTTNGFNGERSLTIRCTQL
jgi:hypothetical protein